MNDKDLFNIWSSSLLLSADKNPEAIINKLKNDSSMKTNSIMELIKLKTQKLILIISLIVIGTGTVTNFGQSLEVGYLALLALGLISYVILSREILFKNITSLDMVTSLKSKISVLESYNRNYRLYALMFSGGVVAMILYQVLNVLPIGLDLQIECGVIIAILIGAVIYKNRSNHEDYFSAKVEINQLKAILKEITLIS